MLGETDESHIIRTIEYWDAEQRRWPQRKHTAVLVAERINSRFFNVINRLSLNIPIIGIQCNVIAIGDAVGLHFTRIIDSYVEKEVETVEESSPQDETVWERDFPEQVKLARELQAFAGQSFENVELRFLPQYIAIRAGRYDRIKLWSRKRGHALIGYRLNGDHFDDAVAACEAAEIEPTQKRGAGEILLTSDLKSFSKHLGLHRQLLKWVNNRDLQFKGEHGGEPARDE